MIRLGVAGETHHRDELDVVRARPVEGNPNDTGGIGSAAVDNTTGAYSMTVPAGADGRDVTMVYPLISLNQKVGFTKLNGIVVAPQISSTVPAVFGPSGLTGAYDNIPIVSGVTAVFSPAAPSAPGGGLKVTFTAVPRSLTGGSNVINQALPFSIGNELYQITNRGSGYAASPGLTVTGGVASSTTGDINSVHTTGNCCRSRGCCTGTVRDDPLESSDAESTSSIRSYQGRIDRKSRT